MKEQNTDMNYQDFREQILDELRERIEEDEVLRVQEILKNNTVRTEGVYLLQPGKRSSPTLYMDQMFEQYCQGRGVKELADELIDFYRSPSTQWSSDLEFYQHFEVVKEHLAYRLIYAEQNEELLQRIPHRRFLDFAIVYYCIVEDERVGSGTITIYQTHLDMWKITEQELYEAAYINTPKLLPPKLFRLSDLITRLLEGTDVEEERETEIECINELQETDPELYILTNEKKLYGAVAMLYPDVLEEFAQQMECSLFILPSSIHEVILLPRREETDVAYLKTMVREVNDEQVAPEEILSYHVYLYETETKDILCL